MSVSYTPAIAGLLNPERVCPLDAGTPNAAVEAELRRLSPREVFAPDSVVDSSAARCCLAGLWLYHDFLDEAHVVCQEIDTAEGSFWHAIVHRREPDYSNAGYWFRRVGEHPIYPELAREARRLAEQYPTDAAEPLRTQSQWDPLAFVDLCRQAVGGERGLADLCRSVQMAEWRLLFDHCYRQATGL